MRFADWLLLLLLLVALPACGGSSDSDDDDAPDEGPTFATTVNTGLAVPSDFADAVRPVRFAWTYLLLFGILMFGVFEEDAFIYFQF